MKHLEYDLQKQVCKYLDTVYPEVLYISDTVASVKLTMPQAGRNKAIQKEGFKCPDLIIFEPRGLFYGLLIELKVKSIHKKNGDLLSNPHVEGQKRTIQQLMSKGYCAGFAIGFDHAKRLIDDYMRIGQEGIVMKTIMNTKK